jgi:hypothetical protein
LVLWKSHSKKFIRQKTFATSEIINFVLFVDEEKIREIKSLFLSMRTTFL